MFNLSKIPQFVKENEKDIVLSVSIILIALIAFGAGRLTAPKIVQEPVSIEQIRLDPTKQASVAAIGASVSSSENSQQIQGGGMTQNINESNSQKGKFVASKNSKYYHWPWSPYAKKIKPENQIWFNSEEEAQKVGYQRASNFLETAPAGYDF